MSKIKKEDPKWWDALSNYQEITRNVRQDSITDEKTQENLVRFPLEPAFPEKELRRLDLLDMYNTTSHLGMLSVIAHAINEKFHAAVRSIFGIDKDTGSSKDNTVQYSSGPIKALERCKAKTENDYAEESFPSSSKVLDFVRGSLIFDKCIDCVKALDTLQEAAALGKTCIKRIGRIKNMFIGNRKKGLSPYSYADVKASVLVEIDRMSMVCGKLTLCLSHPM